MIYRNTRTRKGDPNTNRRYGETGAGDKVRLDVDRKWFSIGFALGDHRPHVRGKVREYVSL